MKKLLLIFAISFFGVANAKDSAKNFNFEIIKTTDLFRNEIKFSESKIEVSKSIFLFGEWTYTWTSTCGTSYSTTFTGNWTPVQMANYIADYNYTKCGVRPYVKLQLTSDMM